MLDPHDLRTNLDRVQQSLATRGYVLEIEQILALEAQRKQLQMQTQEAQQRCNEQERRVGQARAQGHDVSAQLIACAHDRVQVETLETELKNIQEELLALNLTLPNMPHATVPVGRSETENVIIRRWGEPKQFSFTPKDHVDLGCALDAMDFSSAAKLSGARFVVLSGWLARLQRALIQFMLDTHHQRHGYEELYVPYIVRAESLYGTGQLPKFAEEQFALRGDADLYLIPTAEVSVTNLARDRIFTCEELPKKYVCHTPCFRSEAGSYGKDTRGMIRQHQFEKVELVQFTKPQDSYERLERLTCDAEYILQALELPYRVVSLCTGDLGFAAAKTYDIEVWLPSQAMYREISSCSNYESFQARRIQARWRNPITKKLELIHTLNGSGLAVGRTLVALLENYQDAEGNIKIPEVLQKYVGCHRMDPV